MSPLKVMLCCSSEKISNGYSVVGYNLAKHIATKDDIALIYWGFQKFQENPEHSKQRQLPKNVTTYDAWEHENPKQMGFGFDQIVAYVDEHKPEVIIVYNDFVVVSNILEKLKTCTHKEFKTIIYIDQVYDTQKKEYIRRLNDQADFVITFTPYWDKILKDQGMIKPSDWLQHGFDSMKNYPVPKKLARMHFGLKQDDFIVINANRCQIRKKWEYTIMAWAEFVSRHMNEPVKLLIATHPTSGGLNLIEVYEYELKRHGLTIDEGMKHIILIDNPQQLTDEDMNTLYNTADVGINTTMGAGFELTNFEHGGMGYPQIASYIGGIRDFLDPSCAKVLNPVLPFYTDTSCDGCPGRASLIDYKDAVDALEEYYANEDLRKEHGQKSRKRILENYKWIDLGEKFYKIIKKVGNIPDKPVKQVDKISLDDIESLEKNFNISQLASAPVPVEVLVEAPVVAPVHVTEEPKKLSPEVRKNDIKNRLKKKLDDKKKKIELADLIKLKKQLDALKA
jgi:glycosyltransferase involved in cell wall biosynthesis